MKNRFLICVIMLFACASCGDLKFTEFAQRTAAERKEKIVAEIKTLGDHSWAGEYYEGDGLGVNVSLSIAPKNGYVFEWRGCMGVYDRNYGFVTEKDGRIRLAFTFENKREGFQGIAKEFFPVRWGERKYLIPCDKVLEFCDEINRGTEPRKFDIVGFFLLRIGDFKKTATGLPELPKEYLPYLLTKPIEATILSVDKTVRFKDGNSSRTDSELTLNVGKKDGLRKGMTLCVIKPDDIYESVKVTHVRENDSEALLSQDDETKPLPIKGWRLSTRLSWYPGKDQEKPQESKK